MQRHDSFFIVVCGVYWFCIRHSEDFGIAVSLRSSAMRKDWTRCLLGKKLDFEPFD